MSNTLDDILSEAERFILRRQTFETAKVFQREEGQGDEPPETVAVYLYPETIQAEESDFALDLRIYPVNVLIKFQMKGEGFHEDEDDRHAWIQAMHDYVDAVMKMVKDWNEREENTSNAYFVRLRPVVLNFNARPELLANDDNVGGGVHRALLVLDFHTVENRT